MASFSKAQKIVHRAEGGYQSLYNDKGNWTSGSTGIGTLIGTKYGISAPTLKSWLGKTPTKHDMQNLSYSEALRIYRKRYWDKYYLGLVKNQSVANLIYDGIVNQGSSFMRGAVSKSAVQIGVSGLTKTNALTPSSVIKLNRSNQKDLFATIKANRKKRYEQIGGRYLKGWLNRLSRISFSRNIALFGDNPETSGPSSDSDTPQKPKFLKKHWKKMAIFATVGVTGVAIYYTIKALKKK